MLFPNVVRLNAPPVCIGSSYTKTEGYDSAGTDAAISAGRASYSYIDSQVAALQASIDGLLSVVSPPVANAAALHAPSSGTLDFKDPGGANIIQVGSSGLVLFPNAVHLNAPPVGNGRVPIRRRRATTLPGRTRPSPPRSRPRATSSHPPSPG